MNFGHCTTKDRHRLAELVRRGLPLVQEDKLAFLKRTEDGKYHADLTGAALVAHVGDPAEALRILELGQGLTDRRMHPVRVIAQVLDLPLGLIYSVDRHHFSGTPTEAILAVLEG
jgi:hypothetical protein